MDVGKLTGQNLPNDLKLDNADLSKIFKDTKNDIQDVLKHLDLNLCSQTPNTKIGGAPVLETPSIQALDEISTLSTDALLSLLGAEERKVSVETGMASLKADADEIKSANEERIANLEKQVKEAEKAKVANVFKKIFSWISTIVQAVVAVATVVAGAMTGNPLLIIGGALMAVSAVDQIVGEATGKTMFTHFAKACGASDDVAAYVGMGMGLFVGIAGAICTGAGAVKGAVQAANTTMKAIKYVTLAGDAISGVSQMGQGAATIAGGVFQKRATDISASNKDLEALLAKLRMIQDMDLEHLSSIMEKFSNMSEQVNDIIANNNATIKAVVTA